MVDLSQLQSRQTTQGRLTNNRDAVLPTRRNLDAPNAVVRADMRNAFRGDEVDEVRRTLGLVNQAVDGLGDMRRASLADEAKKDAASGGLDASAGKAYDPAKAKSRAYQDAYYRVSSEQKQTTWETGLDAQVTELVNKGASLDEIHQLVTTSVAAHAGEAKDIYPSDETKLHVAQSTMQFTSRLEVKLTEAIKTRTDKELLESRAATVIAALRDGRPLDFEASVRPLIEAGLAPEAAKGAIRGAVMRVAMDPEKPRPELLEELLYSTQADGKTPSLSDDEYFQVQNAHLQAEGLQKKKEKEDHEARQDALTLELYDASLKGEVVDDRIDQAVRDQTFTAQEGITLRGAFERLRNDELEGEANEELVNNLALKLAVVRPNYAGVRAEAESAYRDGLLGTGRAAVRAYLGLMRDTAHDSQSRAQALRGGASAKRYSDGAELLDNLIPVERVDGYLAPADARLVVNARADWRERVAKGSDPVDAADAVAKVWNERRPKSGPWSWGPTLKPTMRYNSNGVLNGK